MDLVGADRRLSELFCTYSYIFCDLGFTLASHFCIWKNKVWVRRLVAMLQFWMCLCNLVTAEAAMGVEDSFMNCHFELGSSCQKDRVSMFGGNENLETILHWS